MASAHWKDAPEDQDLPAAESYLALLVGPDETFKLAQALCQRISTSYHVDDKAPVPCRIVPRPS